MENIKCNKTGCKGTLDMKKIKFITAQKSSAKCKKCGKNNFITRVAPKPKIKGSIVSYLKRKWQEPK